MADFIPPRELGSGPGQGGAEPKFTGDEIVVSEFHPVTWLGKMQQRQRIQQATISEITRVTRVVAILSAIEVPDDFPTDHIKAIEDWL